MFKVIDAKDSGKTKKLLEECAKNDGMVICKHPEKIDYKCQAYGIEKEIRAIGYQDAIELIKAHKDAFKGKKVYIDELGAFVHEMIPEFEGFALSGD